MKKFALYFLFTTLVLILCAGIVLYMLFRERGPYGKSAAMVIPLLGPMKNTPLDFYGYVVDQHGNGVPDVLVEGDYSYSSRVEHLNGQGYTPHRLQVKTDERGYFVLKGLEGKRLTWRTLSRDGYRFMPQRVYTYTYQSEAGSTFKPDASQPVEFYMWKKTGAKSNVIAIPSFGTDFSKTSVISIYLLPEVRKMRGRHEDADIIVTEVHGTPADPKARNTPAAYYDWSFIFETPRGGMVEAKDPFLMEAPERGYAPRLEAGKKATDPDWGVDRPLNLYFELADKSVYGVLSVSMRNDPRRQTIDASFMGWLNKDGERSLERD